MCNMDMEKKDAGKKAKRYPENGFDWMGRGAMVLKNKRHKKPRDTKKA